VHVRSSHAFRFPASPASPTSLTTQHKYLDRLLGDILTVVRKGTFSSRFDMLVEPSQPVSLCGTHGFAALAGRDMIHEKDREKKS